jgi:N-acetylglucosamine-6-phosphate deacetylase
MSSFGEQYPGRVDSTWRVETGVGSETRYWWGADTISGSDTSPPDSADVSINLQGAYLSAPLSDTHTHGCAGIAVSSSAEDMTRLLEAYRGMGVAKVQLSTVTLGEADIQDILRAARNVMSENDSLLGIHLEGPFLSPEKKGAHDKALLSTASRPGIQALLENYLDVVTAITLDPLSVEEGVIGWLVDNGISVAIGHTMATYDEALRAFQEGATVLTHAFNAMLPVSSREPGPVMAAIDEGAYLEVIADGHHVHPSLVQMLFREAPGRVILVTDSMPAAGQGDGDYTLGSLEVTVTDGVARTTEGALAGSTLLLPDAIHNAHRFGVPAEQAIAAGTTTPLRAYGREVPSLSPGDPARLAVWSEDARLSHTIHDGMVS